MADLQLYVAIGLPVVANGAMFLLFQSNVHKFVLLRVEQVMDARPRLLELR